MAIKLIQVYFQGWIFFYLFFFKLCCPGGLAHSFLPTLYMCQDQGKAYSWLQWLISLSPRCSLRSPFHWSSADISPLPTCELSFCSADGCPDHKLLDSKFYFRRRFTAVQCAPSCEEHWGAASLTKLGDRKKRIKAGLKQGAKICCQMLKFLMFGLGFFGEEREVDVKWLLQSHKGLGWQEKVSFLGLLHQVIFRSIHGTYCWSYSQSPLLPQML